MHTSGASFVFIILSAISSVNYGFPHNMVSPSTVPKFTHGSTNHVTPLGTSFTSATPTKERHTETTSLSNPSTSNHGEDSTSTTGHIDGDIEVNIEETLANDANDAVEVRRPAADISRARDAINQDDGRYNDNASKAQDGFPWWSLMLILLATIVIIIAIALPIVLYNRRLNQRRAVIKNSKRASEIIVDSWMAASQSSIPPASSSSTSSESANDDDAVDKKNNTMPQSNLGVLTADDENSHDITLGPREDAKMS